MAKDTVPPNGSGIIDENQCVKCDSDLGLESSNGRLIVGNWSVEIIRGSCNVCGNPVKWYSTDWRMKQLMKGRKK